MGKKDPRIDAYIARSAPFARPILKHLRKVVHAGCPVVVETIKWGMPAFEHKGPLCGMAAFKAHATFGFWKGKLLQGSKATLGASKDEAMGQFGRIGSKEDLPSERRLVALVRRATLLNERGVKAPKVRKPKPRLTTPSDLMAALKKKPEALDTYRGLTPSHRREYVAWITEAKQNETRRRRVQTAVAWMSQGRVRNWKYVK